MITQKLFQGDCLDEMKKLPDNSVDSIVTDPPYGLSFMGKKWDYDVPSVEIWLEAFRVLKPGGHLLSFGGTRTYHWMVVNIEDAGFEIRDQIQWLYGSGFPKSLNISKALDKEAGAERKVISSKSMPDIRGSSVNGEYQPLAKGKPSMQYDYTAPTTNEAKEWAGWGTALKPANEPIVLARKPLSEKTIAVNVLKWGTGALNIDKTRIGTEERFNPPTHKTNTAAMGDFSMCNGEGPFTTGRFPANLILDETAAEMLDEQTGERPPGYRSNPSTQSGSKFQSNLGVGERGYTDTGGASRFFYVAKTSKRERGKDNTHPTVKPIKLMSYLCRLITPPGGTVLDPFMGSGSTGLATLAEGFEFIGIEKEPAYFEIACKRIAEAESKQNEKKETSQSVS